MIKLPVLVTAVVLFQGTVGAVVEELMLEAPYATQVLGLWYTACVARQKELA